MEAVLVTLDRDGMALVRARRPGRDRADPAAAGLRHHRRGRHGAGDRRPLPGRGGRLRRGRGARQRRRRPGSREDRRGPADAARRSSATCSSTSRARPGKVFDQAMLLAEVGRRRSIGQRVVFTNGCFDILHVGHVRLLREAAALGDFLVVGLNSDASVRRLKGPERPRNSEEARAELLAALDAVDAVTVFDEDTPLRPDRRHPARRAGQGRRLPARGRRGPGRGRGVGRAARADPAGRGLFDDEAAPAEERDGAPGPGRPAGAGRLDPSRAVARRPPGFKPGGGLIR